MSMLRSMRPVRRLTLLALETGVASWAWKNRRSLLARLGVASKEGTDRSRPEGDRFVPPRADRQPSDYEAARAEEAAADAPDVSGAMESADSKVRIRNPS